MFRSLGVRNFRLFAMGQVVSNTGTWMQRIGQDWLVLQLSGGSGMALGITTMLQFLPMLLFGLWGGALVDRLPKRYLLMGTQAVMGALALGIAALALTGSAQVWHVYLFAFGLGLVTVVDNPARQTFVVEMVGKKDLPNAIALNSAGFQLGRVVGPAVAGVLIAAVGTGSVFLINAVSYLAVLGGLYLMRPAELSVTEPAPKEKGQIRAGLRYVRSRPDLVLLLTMLAFLAAFGTNVQNQLALMTSEVFESGAGGFGGAASVLAVGSLAGALLAARRDRPRLRLVLTAAFVFAATEVIAAFMPGYISFAIVLAPMGVAFLTFTTAMNATIQLSVDEQMRGRVMGLYMLLFLGMAPIGAPIVGWLADTYGPRVSLTVGGVVTLVVTTIVAVLLARHVGVTVRRTRRPPFLRIVRRPLADQGEREAE